MRREFIRAVLAIGGVLVSACTRHHVETAAQPQSVAYTLAVNIHPDEPALDVSGTIRIPPSDQVRDSLRLMLIERVSDWNVEILEPKVSAGPALTERQATTKERVAGERGSVRWTIRPRQPIPAGAPITLRFSYRASGQTSFIYHIGQDVAFASGWGDAWYPTIEGTGAAGTGVLTFQVPHGWKVIAGGTRRSNAGEEARGTFRYAQSLPTAFTFSAGPYTVVRRDGATPISAWLLKPRTTIGGFLDGVSSMLDVLSREFGPYVFDEMSLVEVPRAVAIESGFNAFSPLGFLVLNSRAFDPADVKVEHEWLGHEMSHQWFPHSVTWDPPGFLYLEEALAEYGGMRIVETLDGDAAAKRMRTIGYEFDPIYSASAYFRLVGAGADQPLATMTSGINQRNLAYNKGSFVFDMLAREMGQERFRQLMRGLTGRRPAQTITWNRFRDAVTKESGRNMDWFFTQWLDRAGAPDFHMIWKQENDTVHVNITQPAPYYRVTLKVEARGTSGERMIQSVEILGGSVVLDFPIGFKVSELILDPNYEVLRWTPEFHTLVDSARSAGH